MADDRWRDDNRQGWGERPYPGATDRYSERERALSDEGYRYRQAARRDEWARRAQNDFGSDPGAGYSEPRSGAGYGPGYSRPYRQEPRTFTSSDYEVDYRYGRDARSNASYDYADADYRARDADRDWWDRTKDQFRAWGGDDDARRRRQEDELREHRGRGPKGYVRSDERIREDVSDRLSDDWRVDASDIEVSVEAGEVTLSGFVSSREDKRRAEDLADDCSGVKHVQNNLRINRTASSSADRQGDPLTAQPSLVRDITDG